MAENTENVVGEFAADLTALRADVANLADRMAKLVSHQTQSAGHRVSEAVDDATDKITSTAANAQKSVCAAGREIESSIERNPLTSVLIAFGVGISFGLLSRLRG